MRMFPILEQEIAARGIKKTVIASAIGISSRCLYNKLEGKAPLNWDEACAIQKKFFPDVNKDHLYKTAS